MSRPRAFVGVETDHGFMIVNRNDFHQNPSMDPYGVGYQLLTFGAYDKEEISFVLKILRNRYTSFGGGVVALDVGANIGVHTLEMAREMENWGQVLAFEAQERLYYALCGNISLNNLSNAQAFNLAIGETVGFIQIPQPDYNKPASFGSLELQYRPTQTEFIGQTISYSPKNLVSVPMNKLDNLKPSRVDFLKIDVEGMEIQVLRGSEQLLHDHNPDILIEWIKSDKTELISFLSSFGYNSIIEIDANLYAKQEI